MAAGDGRIPRQRVIFDENRYYGADGREWARERLVDNCVLTGEEADLLGDDELFGEAMDMMREDREEELAALTGFLDDGRRSGPPSQNPLAGNPVAVRGSAGRWDHTSRGMTVYEDFAHAMDTSPSGRGADNIFADCEIQRIWDENGALRVEGAHHDGRVSVEVRQLTDEGAEAYGAVRDAESSWEALPFSAAGRTYDGSDRSVLQAMRDIWDDPDLCRPPRYVELAFGCPAAEWERPARLSVSFDWHGPQTVDLVRAEYEEGGAVALVAIDPEDGGIWADITVNLGQPPKGSLTYLDTNDCPRPLIDALEDAGLLRLTGSYARSGYGFYSLAEIDPTLLGRVPTMEEYAQALEAERENELAKRAEPEPIARPQR